MCANGAIDVLDQILLGGLILSDPLPSTRVVLTALLVIEGLPYLHPHLVIHERLSIRWWFKIEELNGGLPEVVQSISEPTYDNLFEGPTADLFILRRLESVVWLQIKDDMY